MANFSSLLTSVIQFSSKGFVKNSLTGAGLGLGSYVLLRELYDQFLSYLQSNFANLSTIFYAINLSGLDVALSIVISAVGIRIYLNSQQVFLRTLSTLIPLISAIS